MIQPNSKLFSFAAAHDPAHLLDMRGQRFAEWSCRYANHYIWNIKPFGQNVRGNQPMNGCVRLGKVFNHIPLEVFIVPVTYRYEVVSLFGKLPRQICAMIYARAKDNRLNGLAKYLMGFLYPLGHDVPCDLHAPCCGFDLTPFTSNQLRPRHVNLF